MGPGKLDGHLLADSSRTAEEGEGRLLAPPGIDSAVMPSGLGDEGHAVEALLQTLRDEEKVAILSGCGMWTAGGVPRLGVPPLQVTDGPHGARGPHVKGDLGTMLSPCEAALAATFSESIVEEVGELLGEDCARKDCHVLLGPTLNLQRYPISGRHFECFSEDPHLTARLAVAWVKGVQRHVAACAKHFVGNDQETDRGTMNSLIDERALREVYLPPFEAVVREAQVESVMCGYNRMNGAYCTENGWLLEKVLRGEWGFSGFVMSDWWGNRGGISALEAGLNLEMPGIEPRYFGGHLEEAVREGRVSRDLLDARCRPLLRAVLTSSRGDATPQPSSPACRRDVLRRAAAASLVLARNEGDVLPLQSSGLRRVAVLGPNAADTVVQGGGSSRVRPRRCTTILEALRASLEPRGIGVVHESGCQWEWLPSSLVTVETFGLCAVGGCDPAGQPVLAMSPVNFLNSFNDAFLSWAAWVSRSACFRRCCMPLLRRCGLRPSTPEEAAARRPPTPLAMQGLERPGALQQPRCRAACMVVGAVAVSLAAVAYAVVGQIKGVSSLDWAVRVAFASVATVAAVCVAWWRRGGGPERRREIADDRLLEAAERAAAEADACILVLGTHGWWEVEGIDQPHFGLLGRQNELAQRVAAAASGRPVIAVLNVGSPKELPWLDQVPGVIVAHFGGEELAPAVVDVLLGEVNPAGRLPTTWPRRTADVPAVAAAAALPMSADQPVGTVEYMEGVFVGYRGYTAGRPWAVGAAPPPEPVFPFGHGLSYTRFGYGPLQVALREPLPVAAAAARGAAIGGGGGQATEATAGPRASAFLHVRNEGPCVGEEVVQLYVEAEGCPRSLRGFARTRLLAPGESQLVTFELGPRELGARYVVSLGSWRSPQAGEVLKLEVGASCADVRQRAELTLG